jgi:hypothetical protein
LRDVFACGEDFEFPRDGGFVFLKEVGAGASVIV